MPTLTERVRLVAEVAAQFGKASIELTGEEALALLVALVHVENAYDGETEIEVAWDFGWAEDDEDE